MWMNAQTQTLRQTRLSPSVRVVKFPRHAQAISSSRFVGGPRVTKHGRPRRSRHSVHRAPPAREWCGKAFESKHIDMIVLSGHRVQTRMTESDFAFEDVSVDLQFHLRVIPDFAPPSCHCKCCLAPRATNPCAAPRCPNLYSAPRHKA